MVSRYLNDYISNSQRYVKRASITARLFFHTSMCLLPQIHPLMAPDTPDMFDIKMYHARQICGIVAHVKDR
jgi:hypothetical protein